ncbi:MAG: VOC family protein [Hyphomonadaceae bacterium]
MLSADHFALPIRNVPATLEFWGDVLGLPLVKTHEGDDWGGKPWLMMVFALADGRHVSLCARRGDRRAMGPKEIDLPHFAFSAPDKRALKTWETRLTRAGVEFDTEEHGRHRSLYFRDPNDIMIEITAPPSTLTIRDAPEAHAAVEAWLRRR